MFNKHHYTVDVLIEAQCMSATSGLQGARPLISTIKSVIQYLQYAYIYSKQQLRGPLLTRKWRFAHVRQPNRPEYCSNFSAFGRSFDILSGIWCEFDVMCFVPQGRAHLLGHVFV